jgi:hypothetical protein
MFAGIVVLVTTLLLNVKKAGKTPTVPQNRVNEDKAQTNQAFIGVTISNTPSSLSPRLL